MPTMLGKGRLPGAHQTHLANRRSGLQLVNGTRPHAPAQPAHARRHRPRGDQHQFDTSLAQRNHLPDPARHGRLIEPATVCREQSAADFHHPAPRVRHLVPHHPRLNHRSDIRRHGHSAAPGSSQTTADQVSGRR